MVYRINRAGYSISLVILGIANAIFWMVFDDSEMLGTVMLLFWAIVIYYTYFYIIFRRILDLNLDKKWMIFYVIIQLFSLPYFLFENSNEYNVYGLYVGLLLGLCFNLVLIFEKGTEGSNSYGPEIPEWAPLSKVIFNPESIFEAENTPHSNFIKRCTRCNEEVESRQVYCSKCGERIQK